MRIQIEQEPFLDLTAWWIVSKGMEFSGLGLVERKLDVLHVVGVDLLNVGSYGYTEIPPHRQLALPLNPLRKLWFHAHPLGRAEPGPNNWSGTDHHTAALNPFGGVPELVQWSCSIVCTPTGWTGRVDVYLPSLQTFYVPVTPTTPTVEDMEKAYERVTPELQAYAAELSAEFHARTLVGEMDDMFDEMYPVQYKDLGRRLTKLKKKKPLRIMVGGRNIFTRYYEELDTWITRDI